MEDNATPIAIATLLKRVKDYSHSGVVTTFVSLLAFFLTVALSFLLIDTVFALWDGITQS